MSDRERVMKELSWLINNFPQQKNPEDEADKMCNAINAYCSDALALLKAQMPRVMTFEEVYKFSCKAFDQYGEDSPLYVECRERYPYQIKWLTVERAHEWMRDDETMERRKLTYNNAKERWGWRCWTSRPTPEQMASTLWGGEK